MLPRPGFRAPPDPQACLQARQRRRSSPTAACSSTPPSTPSSGPARPRPPRSATKDCVPASWTSPAGPPASLVSSAAGTRASPTIRTATSASPVPKHAGLAHRTAPRRTGRPRDPVRPPAHRRQRWLRIPQPRRHPRPPGHRDRPRHRGHPHCPPHRPPSRRKHLRAGSPPRHPGSRPGPGIHRGHPHQSAGPGHPRQPPTGRLRQPARLRDVRLRPRPSPVPPTGHHRQPEPRPVPPVVHEHRPHRRPCRPAHTPSSRPRSPSGHGSGPRPSH